MIQAEQFIRAAQAHGFNLYSGVPCSYLKPFINYVIDASDLRYVGAANEGDAVAIAAGAELAGTRSVAMFQNSGFGNTVNPLTSLNYTFRSPVLLIPTLRGEPGGPADEPQHELMGQITTGLLELMKIPWAYFPTEDDAIDEALTTAVAHMDQEGTPYALVMKKGSVAPRSLQSTAEERAPERWQGRRAEPATRRNDMLRAVQTVTTEDTGAVAIATTGYTGRELYACEDRANQLYMVGSMGCAVTLGLGIALAQPQRPVVVLDGDGAALMRLGAQATVGFEAPPNLVHVLLDNGIHESTGGQSTVSRSVDFCAIAAASGYRDVKSVAAPADVAAAVAESMAARSGPVFVHAPTLPGVPEQLPRPSVTPAEVATRLRAFLQS
ncbi:MAG: phosphonopyruvate decarboxylase [Gammaproteobacteria bacterium]|nr:phosphonopyruvate decarboxylase [Gammaproteobacteria bacterium]